MLDRRVLLIIGAVILGLAIIGITIEGSGGPEVLGILFLTPAGLTIFNPLFWIIFIIVLFANKKQGQQQQQQIVVVTGPSNSGPQIRCPGCKGLNPDSAGFCGHCGRSFATP